MVALIEFFKYLGAFFIGDTRSVVGDLDNDALLTAVELDADVAVFSRELDGVVDDILPYLRHKLLIADIGDLLKVDVKVDVLSRPLWFEHNDDLSDLLVKQELGFFADSFLIFELGELEDIC